MSSAFQKAVIKFVILFLYFESAFGEKENKQSEILLCRQCGHTVVKGREVVSIKSSVALHYKNISVLGPKGILVQTLKNPQGTSFDVITASKANIIESGEAYEEFSWFPGYAWRIAGCPRCGAHLGWTFTATNDENDDELDEDDYHDLNNEKPADKYQKPKGYSFAGLILSRLIRESYADSLIITPKVYQK